MATLNLDRVTCIYPSATLPAVNHVSLHLADGEFLTLLGEPGAGKSTLLRVIAGLEETKSGRIRIAQNDVTYIAPKHRNVSMVFQNYALYPQMSVSENMSLALKVAGIDEDARQRKVIEVAEALDLVPLLEESPNTLTGRQRQRVSIGRAIVREPNVLLFDEPFSSLNQEQCFDLLSKIQTLTEKLGITTIYSTSKLAEAEFLNTRIALMSTAQVIQTGTLESLRSTPKTYTAQTMIADQPQTSCILHVVNSIISLDGHQRKLTQHTLAAYNPVDVLAVVPSKDIRIVSHATELRANVGKVTNLADGRQMVTLHPNNQLHSHAQVVSTEGDHHVPGESVWLSTSLNEALLFDPKNGRLLEAGQ